MVEQRGLVHLSLRSMGQTCLKHSEFLDGRVRSGSRFSMRLRRIIGPFLIVGSLVCAMAHAQFDVPWWHTPMVVVVSTTGDPRSRLVDEAVTFWDKTQAEIGSGFRLGSVTHIVQLMPEEALQSLSQSVLGALGGAGISQSLRDPPGDITIYLSRSEFVSFTGPFDANMKRVIGIRGAQFPPMNLPNVALNVITHELGHAIGLGQSSDPSKLMCGRSAPYGPALFRSDTPHIFPLTDDEKRQLRLMYPP
jgi:hypothetical protein